MHNPSIAAWSLAGILAVIGLATAPLERWVYRSDPGPRRKLIAYGITIAVLWSLAAAAIRIGGWTALLRAPAAPAAWLPGVRITAPAIGAVTGAYLVLAMLPLLQSLRGPRWRAAYAAAIRRGFHTLPGLLPNTGAERAAFILVSISAGVCEEVLFRGFLIRQLHGGALALPIVGALAASSVIFGLGHAYQGLEGMAGSAICGLAMGLLFLLSGSLIPAIVAHALLDIQVPLVLWPVSGAGVAGRPRPLRHGASRRPAFPASRDAEPQGRPMA